MRPGALTSVVSLVLLAALATSSPAAGPSVVTCESIIDPGGTTEWRSKRVVLGVVAVPPAYIPQTVPTGETRWPYWSKAGIVVPADSPAVTASVPKAWRHRAAIGC
jgi:hypothetical protein